MRRYTVRSTEQNSNGAMVFELFESPGECHSVGFLKSVLSPVSLLILPTYGPRKSVRVLV